MQAIGVAKAEFEEKQFECAFNNELYLDGPVFPSGQVLENITGYDAAADPGPNHVLWRILAIPRPAGIRLVPTHFTGSSKKQAKVNGKLPQHPISFIVQFKRPEYVGAGGAQYPFWNQPYYRFSRAEAQHKVLRKLEKALTGSTVVRYASPAFHRYQQLEQAQLAQDVVSLSGLVSPRRLARHKVWTYVAAGTVGKGNPDGEEIAFPAFDGLFSRPSREQALELVARGGIEEHLAALAAACRDLAARRSRSVDVWIAAAAQMAEIPADIAERLRDYTLVQSVLTSQRASWWILDGDQHVPIAETD